MHRDRLIRMLENYATRFPEELKKAGKFIDFLKFQPRCFERDCWDGHITGSAWLIDVDSCQILLTHHKKLNRWLQLGGHSDGEPDPMKVALHEAQEESGLVVSPIINDIFDIDIHEIPSNKKEPNHLHYDVRFAMKTLSGKEVTVTDESNALAWVSVLDLPSYTNEKSILRMVEKSEFLRD